LEPPPYPDSYPRERLEHSQTQRIPIPPVTQVAVGELKRKKVQKMRMKHDMETNPFFYLSPKSGKKLKNSEPL
jgi:hypothetical protein